MLTTDLLIAALVLPMLRSLLTVFMGKTHYRTRAYFAFTIAAVTFILMLLVASTVWTNGTISVTSDWLANLGGSLILYVDPLAIFFALIASFLGLIAILYSIDDMRRQSNCVHWALSSASCLGIIHRHN